MFTNKNTPLLLALGIAAVVLAVGFWIATPVSVGLSLILAVLVLGVGMLSRRMTHLWLTDDVRLWAREIWHFEKADAKQPPPEQAIVFVGSSTIRFWKTLADDMSPLPVIRRGFGGSRILDAIYYADRIVVPYNPVAVVLFSGTNDLAGKTPKSADYVVEKVREFCSVIHAALPTVPIYYISITPTPNRWEHWATIQATNHGIERYMQTDDRLHFLDTTAHFLDDQGQPRRELYRWDKIHLNAAGYAILVDCVKPVLLRDLSLA